MNLPQSSAPATASTHSTLSDSTRKVLAIATVAVLLVSIAVLNLPLVSPESLLVTMLVWFLIASLLKRSLAYHPFPTLGPANLVTLVRAAGTALIAGLIPVAADMPALATQQANELLWGLSGWVITLLALDGVDGYLARRSGMSSAFGARFDMEIDALLALVIALFLWQSERAGVWVLGLGLMRYVFVLASVMSEPLRGALYPSFRRKLVCVIQLAALCLMLSPLGNNAVATTLGVLALLALGTSFARDIAWLYAQSGRASTRLSVSTPDQQHQHTGNYPDH